MRVECDIAGIDPQPVLFGFFERVLRYAAERVSADLRAIGRVIVVSPDRFGRAVNSIRVGAIHTNTEVVTAVGKTIARREQDHIVSDIVLHFGVFEDLAAVLADPPYGHLTTWGIDQEEALYVICHEFGHVQDHKVRNDDSDVPDPRAQPFSIMATAEYYGSIVLTELAACRNSALAVTDRLFAYHIQQARERMIAHAAWLRQYLEPGAGHSPATRAHMACQGAWVWMTEVAKLYGSVFRHPDREVDIRAFEAEFLSDVPLVETLTSFSAVYPRWDVPGLITELIPTWRRYGELANVRFVTRDGTDEIEDLAQKG